MPPEETRNRESGIILVSLQTPSEVRSQNTRHLSRRRKGEIEIREVKSKYQMYAESIRNFGEIFLQTSPIALLHQDQGHVTNLLSIHVNSDNEINLEYCKIQSQFLF